MYSLSNESQLCSKQSLGYCRSRSKKNWIRSAILQTALLPDQPVSLLDRQIGVCCCYKSTYGVRDSIELLSTSYRRGVADPSLLTCNFRRTRAPRESPKSPLSEILYSFTFHPNRKLNMVIAYLPTTACLHPTPVGWVAQQTPLFSVTKSAVAVSK